MFQNLYISAIKVKSAEGRLHPARGELLQHGIRRGQAWSRGVLWRQIAAQPATDIYVINEGEIKLMPYEETEHYKLTMQFLDNPERMLKILCE